MIFKKIPKKINKKEKEKIEEMLTHYTYAFFTFDFLSTVEKTVRWKKTYNRNQNFVESFFGFHYNASVFRQILHTFCFLTASKWKIKPKSIYKTHIKMVKGNNRISIIVGLSRVS